MSSPLTRRMHYTDGIRMACPATGQIVDHGRCPNHGAVKTTMVPLVDLPSVTTVRFCSRCGFWCPGGGPCVDCLEDIDRQWARTLAVPVRAPWVGVQCTARPVRLPRPRKAGVGELPRMRSWKGARFWLVLYVADGPVARRDLREVSCMASASMAGFARRWIEQGWLESTAMPKAGGSGTRVGYMLTAAGRAGVVDLLERTSATVIREACDAIARAGVAA